MLKLDKITQTKHPDINEFYWSPGHLEIVKYLLEIGANIEAKDINGKTARNLASSKGNCKGL